MSDPLRPRDRILTVIAALVISVLVVEVVFRMVGYDFEPGLEEARNAWPICYRWPRMPVGDVFFQREGPAMWSGQVLRTGYVLDGGRSEAYANEPDVTATYDADGFRNPDTLSDWEVAVIGDSFVELGHLPYDDLFTTELSRQVGLRVKNVGVSYSGPPAYVAYLEHFAAAPSTRHAVMVFFEGNDLLDLIRERDALRRLETDGDREYRSIESQSSFIRAAWHTVRRLRAQRAMTEPDAFFRERGVTLGYAPPDSADLSDDVRTALDSVLVEWAATARKHRMRPWLAYMPCKRRVLHSHVRYAEPEADVWQPGGLPAYVGEHALQHGISFVDLTPALRHESAAGQMTYNEIWDSHLNRHGAAVVARTLADSLGK